MRLKNGQEIELADGVTREDLDAMLTEQDVLDEDGRHHLDVGWDDVRDVFAQP